MNNEFRGILEEAVVVYLRIFLGGLKRTTKNFSQEKFQRIYLERKARALTLRQSAR
jgi:hypothetical protein